MVGYVAKDQSRGGPGSCSFPVDVYPNQDDIEEFHGKCGNGEINGVPIDPDPTLAGLAIDDEYVEGWVHHLVDEYGTAAQGGVQIYELGNEPGLWHLTHRDFHENPLTYDELWTRTRAYALAVQRVDPTAATMGPSEWGYSHYLCSAADEPWYSCTEDSPDRAAHGGTELVAWYLQQFQALQQQTGVRHLDYFDLHLYPGGGGVAARRMTLRLT